MPMPKEAEERITLRLPRSLHRALSKEKDRERRSLNNLIVVALADWLRLLFAPARQSAWRISA